MNRNTPFPPANDWLGVVQSAVDRLQHLADAIDFVAESSSPGVRAILIHLSDDASFVANELELAHDAAQQAVQNPAPQNG